MVLEPFELALPSPTPHFSTSIVHPSLDHSESMFVEFENFRLSNHCLDQTLCDVDRERLEDHTKVKNLCLGHPMDIDFHKI